MKESNIIDIERRALDYLLKVRKDKGLSERELGELAFPDSVNPWSKVHALWNVKTADKKGLRLRLGDFCALCMALGHNPPEDLFTIWQQIEKE